MNNSHEVNSAFEDFLTYNSSKGDVSISDQLDDFQKLRISALTKAAEMSPHVKEVTIGPNSLIKKEEPEESDYEEQKPIKDKTLIADKIREDLRFTLIMKEYEAKLQEASETIFKNLVNKMYEKRTEIIRKCRQAQLEKCKEVGNEMRKLKIQQEIYSNDNLTILESARLDQQRSQILNRQRIETMNRALEEESKATARIAEITESQSKIYNCFKEITNIFNSEPINPDVYNKYVTSINAVIININTIMEMCNTQLTTDKEVKQAEVLALNILNIKMKIIEELDSIKQEKIKKQLHEQELLKQKQLEEKKAEELRKEAEQQTLQQAQQQTVSELSKKSAPMFYSAKNWNYYEELKHFLDQYESQYKDLLENVSLKKFRFDCQKAVNTPVNALSSVSGLHMRDKYDKLSKLLKGERVQVLDTYVTASQHPQGLAYCTALLAKKIVRQGDLLVSSNPEAAFPLAAITVALWSQFPEFGKLLEAYFHRLCPYLVPMFLPQKEGQTDKQFYLSRGYTYNDEGVVEKQDKFLKRMSGIFRLRCAIWITKTPKFLNVSNPHSLKHGWQWVASFVNIRPEPDICATLLHDFFIVCGSEFSKCYGKQFTKLINLITTDYLAILQNIDEGGPKTRLEVFLQNVIKTGFFQPPTGLLESNTW